MSRIPTRSAVILLAAGAGTRMKSTIPKMLHPVAGRSMLAHALHAAAGISPDYLVAVVGHQRDQVVEAISHEEPLLEGSPRVCVAVQEKQNGTGDAVATGLSALPADYVGTVVVTTSDVPALNSDTLNRLIATHTAEPTAAVTVLTTSLDNPHGYGRILRDADGNVTEIVEEKDATDAQRSVNEVNSAIYAFDATMLRDALTKLDTNNAQGELYLTDVIRIARTLGKLVRAHKVTDSYLVSGVNDRVQLATMNKEFNRRLCRQAMLDGVTIDDPDTTFIDCTVTLGRDVRIHPGTQLKGTTQVGKGAEIGPDTTLTNMVVGEGARVIRTHGDDSTIGAHASVGPFTYIRPGTTLGDNGKLGSFVEAKNATIGRGSKVPHLTYVGDADIGEHSNIGCSSVFVNYDGVDKHRSVVGNHVRIGSDTMIVAPVTVGDGVYSGAGTVIKDDVPAGALVVSGGKQRVIPGWVERRRPGTPSADAAAAATTHNTKER